MPTLAILSALLFGAERRITLRFLDPKSGKPIRNMSVSICQYKGNLPKGPIPVEYVLSSMTARTDENGEIPVVLNDPLPMFIDLHSFDLWNNGPLFRVADVLESGAVFVYERRKDTKPIAPKPKPAEIVLVEKKLTAWDKMRMEIP